MSSKLIIKTYDDTEPVLTINGDTNIEGNLTITDESMQESYVGKEETVYEYLPAGFNIADGYHEFGNAGAYDISGKSIKIYCPKKIYYVSPGGDGYDMSNTTEHYITHGNNDKIYMFGQEHLKLETEYIEFSFNVDELLSLDIDLSEYPLYLAHYDLYNSTIIKLELIIKKTLVSDSTKLVTQRRSFELLYPKQSIYQSFNSTSPADLFGGTWSSITCPYTNAYAWKRTA